MNSTKYLNKACIRAENVAGKYHDILSCLPNSQLLYPDIFLTSFFLNTYYFILSLNVLHNRLNSRGINSLYHYVNSQQ